MHLRKYEPMLLGRIAAKMMDLMARSPGATCADGWIHVARRRYADVGDGVDVQVVIIVDGLVDGVEWPALTCPECGLGVDVDAEHVTRVRIVDGPEEALLTGVRAELDCWECDAPLSASYDNGDWRVDVAPVAPEREEAVI